MESEKSYDVVANNDGTYSIMSRDRSVKGFRVLHLSRHEAEAVVRDLIAEFVNVETPSSELNEPKTIVDEVEFA